MAALSRQSVHALAFDLLTTPLDLLALLLERFGLSGDLRVLARQVFLEPLAGLGEKRDGD
ncbi:hypothetical protein QCM80_42495 [Bradyrhizobium sp. SSUT112]|uniref:hypothetical protein n=1 Tax=Bradyrhizobium sp. SSUT112 TaxID=3040604 RepID=UPI002449EE99|nr:hypothetical protein [Bradyrhizobium sp. SSUT112]MDH2357209.1 hypothetical protein [Bradyrhizobium sp. SSUT112]